MGRRRSRQIQVLKTALCRTDATQSRGVPLTCLLIEASLERAPCVRPRSPHDVGAARAPAPRARRAHRSSFCASSGPAANAHDHRSSQSRQPSCNHKGVDGSCRQVLGGRDDVRLAARCRVSRWWYHRGGGSQHRRREEEEEGRRLLPVLPARLCLLPKRLRVPGRLRMQQRLRYLSACGVVRKASARATGAPRSVRRLCTSFLSPWRCYEYVCGSRASHGLYGCVFGRRNVERAH